MTALVHFRAVLGRCLLRTGRSRSAHGLGGLRGGGTASGNVFTPTCGVTAVMAPTASA